MKELLIGELLALAEQNGKSVEYVIGWLILPTSYFDPVARPCDHLLNDPEKVLEVAKQSWGVQW